MTGVNVMHKSAMGLAVAFPAALLTSSPAVSIPVDVGLAMLIPAHMHYGLVGVIEDYVPRGMQDTASMASMAAAVITAAGLINLTINGDGVTGSIKRLWTRPDDGVEADPDTPAS